jgi:hypothetical protein
MRKPAVAMRRRVRKIACSIIAASDRVTAILRTLPIASGV